MITRRQFLRTSVAAPAALALASGAARGQARASVKVRYNEVVRSMFFAPAYVALSRGLFRDAGLDVEITTANGGDKAMAALLGGSVDIALMGPEVPIYVLNSESPQKVRMFSGMTATDGYLLVSRQKEEKFDWSSLRGKDVLGWRPGSTPLVFLEAAIRLGGLDPQKDVKLNNTIAPPARTGAWLSGQGQYAIFSEPDAAQLELDGKGYVVASVGAKVGMVDYTALMATDSYLRDNAATVQSFTNAVAKAMKWTETARPADLAQELAPFFPGASPPSMLAGVERYRSLKVWKASPVIAPAAIERFQDFLVQARVLDSAKRVRYDALMLPQFADRAS